MEIAFIVGAVWLAYRWGKKDAYKRGFDDGVKKAKKYTLVVKEKD